MIQKAKSTFKSAITSLGEVQTFRRLYERIRYKNMSLRQRITFIVLMTVLPSLAILIGILTSCIYGVDYHSIGISINQSTQRIFGSNYNNQVLFLSLATKIKTFPNGYFQISFSDKETQGATNYPSINVRTQQGTPLKVDLFVKGTLSVSDYVSFYQKYGDDWMFYLRQKIPNIIIREVSNIGFYDLTSISIRSKVQSQLSLFDEFAISIVSVSVQLPSQYLSNTNGTIGWNVFQKQANLVLLTQTSNLLSTFVINNSSTVSGQYNTTGALQGYKDAVILNNSIVVNSSSSNPYWYDGLTSLNILTGTNSTLNQYLLWYYFQSYYNGSFNSQLSQIQFN